MGLTSSQFLSLTANELNALAAHRQKRDEHDREMAAFAGFCAALGVAKWFKEGLPPFNEFYAVPKAIKQYTSEEYIARYNSWT